MEFEVTASRKRPQSLDRLVGQEFVAATLEKSIQGGRIAHAYLFSGPRGTGKTSSARILARSLNCLEGPTVTPCGKCSNCVEIAKGNSLDVIEIDGASNTGVNDIREIKDEVLFAPGGSKYKIYIIDEVHMLSNNAFNALLKTIEEPPPYIIFIFATTEIHKVPATIRSRCQQFNFRLVEFGLVKDLLASVCKEVGIQYEEDALSWIARESTGSVRDAYTLFDQVAAFAEGHITLGKIREKLGLLGVDQLNTLVELLVEEKTEEALDFLDSSLQRGVSVDQFIADLAQYLRGLLFILYGIKKEALLGYGVDRFSAKVLKVLTPRQMEWALGEVIQLFRDIRYSLNPRFELELLVSRLSGVQYHIDPRELQRELRVLGDQLIQGASPSLGKEKKKSPQPWGPKSLDTFEKKVEKTPDPAPVQRGSSLPHPGKEGAPGGESKALPPLEILRKEILDCLRRDSRTLAAAMENSQWSLEGQNLKLLFPVQFKADLVEGERLQIQNKVARELGYTLRVEVRKEEEKKEKREILPMQEQVELVVSTFQGKIVHQATGGER